MTDKQLSFGFRPEFLPTSHESNTSTSDSSSSSAEEFVKHEKSQSYITESYFEFGCSWQFCNVAGPFPSNMVRGGIDTDGTVIYIGRAFHEGDMIPAKVMPDKNACYICYGGEEIAKEDFEVLRSGDFVWEFASGGSIPEGAVQSGQTADGEILYIGRALYQGSQTPGKIQITHGCLYIPFGGEEVPITEYEVLCLK